MLSKFLTTALVLAAFTAPAAKHGKHWRQTTSETIWTARYGNCDAGYNVDLPAGVLGHDGLPPSPNHGFYINLATPSSDHDAAKQPHRIIWVWNGYVIEPGQDAYTLALRSHTRTVKNRDGTEVHQDLPLSTHVGGLPAALVKGSYTVANIPYIKETTSALSRDRTIEYTLTLDTPRANLLQDEATYKKILADFHTTAIGSGQCSND